MSGYTTRATILALMDEQEMNLPQLAARMGVTQDHLAARLGGRGPLTGE